MIAITRYSNHQLTLPMFGNSGVIVQEDFFGEADFSSIEIFNGSGYAAAYHYYDAKFNPVTDDSAFHHYHCGEADCDYCRLAESAIRIHDIAVYELVSFETFREVCALEYDAENDEYWYNNLPTHSWQMRAVNDHWQAESSEYSEEDSDYDSDEDDYSDIDTDSYTYGYDHGETSKRDRYMLRKINWRNLRVIGAGAYGITFTDGKYAIKVGEISRYDVQRIESAAKHGYSVPVYYYANDRRVPAKLLKAVMTCEAYRFGSRVNWRHYVNKDTYKADISVMGLAEPFFDHEDCCYDGREAEAVVMRLRREYSRATGDKWNDAHEGNMGYYNGALVILDF